MLRLQATLMTALLCAAGSAAHVPTLSDGTATDPNSAIRLDDVQISRVFYHEVTPQAPRLWLTWEITRPQAVKVDFAVPFIERLADFRPALAIMGPGWPPADLPFDTPAGLGAVVLDTKGIEPVVYDEVFSGTRAWRFFSTEVNLPAPGRYYAVAYAPRDETGKLWAALGIKEVFTPEDLATIREDVAAVREFHEVGPDAAPPCFLFAMLPLMSAAWLLRRRSSPPT